MSQNKYMTKHTVSKVKVFVVYMQSRTLYTEEV